MSDGTEQKFEIINDDFLRDITIPAHIIKTGRHRWLISTLLRAKVGMSLDFLSVRAGLTEHETLSILDQLVERKRARMTWEIYIIDKKRGMRFLGSLDHEPVFPLPYKSQSGRDMVLEKEHGNYRRVWDLLSPKEWIA